MWRGGFLMCAVLGAVLAPVAAARPPAKPKPRPKPMAFAPATLELAPGETLPVELFVPSPTGKKFQGTLAYEPGEGLTVLPDVRWTGALPPWGAKTFPKVTAAGDASGSPALRASVRGDGGSRTATLPVRIRAPRLEVVPGVFQLTVRITNPFQSRQIHGRFQVSNPDRFLEDTVSREFKVDAGKTQDLVVPLPGAAPVQGEPYDFTFTVETYQGYRSKRTLGLRFPPHT